MQVLCLQKRLQRYRYANQSSRTIRAELLGRPSESFLYPEMPLLQSLSDDNSRASATPLKNWFAPVLHR